jgi:hypothetical protein
MPQEKWLKERSVMRRRPPADVDDQSLEYFARVARLKDEAALWREASELRGQIATRLRTYTARLAAGRVAAVEVSDAQRWRAALGTHDREFCRAMARGAFATAGEALRSIRALLREGRGFAHLRQNFAEHEDGPGAEVVELVECNGFHGAEPDRIGSGDAVRVFKRDRGDSKDGPNIRTRFECHGDRLRTRDLNGGREGRPPACGTRDAAEAERLVLNYFPGSTIGEIRRWSRKRKDTREHYVRIGEIVHRLMDIDRSATANAVAEALELKKSALYELRDVGRNRVANAA